MKKTLKKVVGLTLSLGLLGASLPVTTSAQASDDVVASVGDHKITVGELYEEMKGHVGETTLRTIILEKVLEQNVEDPEALRKKANEDVDKQIEEAGGEEIFQEFLNYQKRGTIEDLRDQIYVANLLQDVMTQHMDLSDESLKKYYEEDYQPKMEAAHILVKTKEEADEVLERLNNGEEFDALAQELSQDTTAKNGGYLGEFEPGKMVKEFEDAVKAGKNNEVIPEPVESQFGFHIIRVLNNGEKLPFDEVKDKVKDQYINAKLADAPFTYGVLTQLIEDAGVKIEDKDLQGAVDSIKEMAQQAEEQAKQAEEAAKNSEAAGEENSAEAETTAETAKESAEESNE